MLMCLCKWSGPLQYACMRCRPTPCTAALFPKRKTRRSARPSGGNVAKLLSGAARIDCSIDFVYFIIKNIL